MRALVLTLSFILVVTVFFIGNVNANPYGSGIYNANVPYGDETSISLTTSGSITINLTPSTSGVLSTSTDTVTVTSSDVIGYKLYIKDKDANTNLVNGSFNIPASANGSPAALANDTWGYNTDGSSDFVGVTTSNVLLKDANGPFTSGDVTTVTYGVKATLATAAGQFTDTIQYTVTPETD
ncbi:hypothetical protein DYH10_03450 [Candidatus Saccharibacteria bacterium CPR2]|nr:hypothetical protein [Candidatus Saccharibacteria bacterium CPR2]